MDHGCQRWLANHKKENVIAGWVRVGVEKELAKLNVHGDHELGSFFLFALCSKCSK
jgi:hypothetical protein